MRPADKNYEVSLPGRTTYSKSWGPEVGIAVQQSVRYAKEDKGGIKRPKPRGWKEPLPYSCLHRSFNRGSGMLFREWKSYITPSLTYWDRYDGDVGAGQGSAADSQNAALTVMPEGGRLDLDGLEERCYRECYNKARQQTVNIGVAILEAGKTASMITSTATKLARAIFALRRGRWKKAASILGVRPGRYSSNWAKKWLEWKYGWMSLLSDIYGSVEHLSKMNSWDWKVSASKRQKVFLNRSQAIGSGFGHCMVVATGWAGVHVRMDFIPSDMLELSALGITNPALMIWESIPHSFVVDWLVPVGDWLQGLDHSCAIASGTACISRIIKQEWSVSGLNDAERVGQYDCTYTNSYTGKRKYVSLSRVVRPLAAPPYPRLQNPLKSLDRMVTALALLRSAFK